MGLLDAFRAALPPALRAQADAELEPWLGEIVEGARRARAAIPLSTEMFAAHVASRLPADVSVRESLARVHAADLWLAYGCASGSAAALEEFDHILLHELRSALAGLDVPGAEPADLAQELRARLLLHQDGVAPRIAEYGGRAGSGRKFADRIRSNLDAADWDTRRQLIRTVVSRVEIGEDDQCVVYRFRSEPWAPPGPPGW